MPEPVASFVGAIQGWLFEHAVLPLLAWAGALQYTEDAFNGTEDVVLGALEIALLVAVLVPLQKLAPYEPPGRGWSVRVDVIYTLLHRLGLIPLAFFFALRPLFDGAAGVAAPARHPDAGPGDARSRR